MKTNKRSFWLVLALAVVCVCAAFVFVGCDDTVTPPPAHTHSFTEWHHTAAEHWRECPADGAATERSEHNFVNGTCECGFDDPRTFGTVTGKITLRGGRTPDDYSGVTVDFGSDDVNVSVDEEGNFSATHVTVGKDYDVTVSKEGYSSYSAYAGLDEEGQTLALTKPFTLEYKRFDLWIGWDGAQHDFSHVNDAEPVIGNNGKTLNVISRDVYDNVATSLWMKNGNSTHTQGIQGLFVKFEDGKYMFARCEKSGNNYKLQWAMNFDGRGSWGGQSMLSVIEDWPDFQNPLTDDQKTKFESNDGLKVTVLRRGGTLYTYVDDVFIQGGTMTLPAAYADDKVQVGFWDYDSKANATWKFDIEETITAYESQIADFAAPEVTAENGKVSFDKTTYKYGERAVLTVTPDDGCFLFALTVNGQSVGANVENGVYSFAVTEAITVSATFMEGVLCDVALTVSGHKMGETVPLSGEVTLTGPSGVRTVTLSSGTATVPALVTPATYTVTFDGADYNAGEIVLEEGATTASVSLEYKRFVTLHGGDFDQNDLTHVNDANPTIGFLYTSAGNDKKSFNVLSTDSYENVAVSYWVKGNDSIHGSKIHGIVIMIDGVTCAQGRKCVVEYRFTSSNGNYYFKRHKEDGQDHNSYGLSAFASAADLMTITNSGDTVAAYSAITGENGYQMTVKKIGNTIALYLGGSDTQVPLSEYMLPTEYQGKTVKVGFYCREAIATTWKFDIQELDALDPATQDVAVTVKGHKMGETVDISATLTNVADATDTVPLGEGTVNLRKIATYKVTATGYNDGYITVDENTTTAEITLEYKRFVNLQWENEFKLLDLSHVNDAEPYVGVGGSQNGLLNVVSTDSYNDVSLSVWFNGNNTARDIKLQGIAIVFNNDNKILPFRLNYDGTDYTFREYAGDDYGRTSVFTSINTVYDNAYADYSDVVTKLESDEGCQVTLEKVGNTVKLYINGNTTAARTIDLSTFAGGAYANQTVKVGFYVKDAKANTTWKFDIEDLGASEPATQNAALPDLANGAAVYGLPVKKQGGGL